MKYLIFVFLISAVAYATEIQKFSDVVVEDLAGQNVSFSQYSGKCALVINTASGCGFTKPNMKWLNTMKKRFPDLAIIAFPSDSFGQEKKTNEELRKWFFDEWKAEYDVFAPVSVTESNVYKFLIKQQGKQVIWNYGKYVIEKDGTTVERYGPQAGAIFNVPYNLNKHLERCVNA